MLTLSKLIECSLFARPTDCDGECCLGNESLDEFLDERYPSLEVTCAGIASEYDPSPLMLISLSNATDAACWAASLTPDSPRSIVVPSRGETDRATLSELAPDRGTVIRGLLLPMLADTCLLELELTRIGTGLGAWIAGT